MSSPKTVFGIVGLGALIAMLAPVFSSAQALTPAISSVAATSTADGTGANITWMTDIPSNSQVEYGTTTSYGTFSALLDSNAPVTSHTVTLSALTPNTLYHFAVLSMASSASATSSSSFAAASADHTFVTASGTGTTTPPTSTTTPPTATSTPVISGLNATPTDTTAMITWTTDQPATSQVAFGTTTNYSASTTPDTSLATSHSVQLTGLTPSLLYHFQAISGNGSTTATSSDQTFMTLASSTGTTTPPTGTTTPPTATSTPPVISNILATPTDTTATITWTTDQPSSSQVAIGPTAGNYTASSTLDSTAVTSHTATVSGLTASTTYHFQIMSGNGTATSTSADQSFMTLASTSTTTPPTGTTTPPTGTTTPPTSTTTPPTTSGGLTMDDLFNLIQQLQSRVSTLESQVQSLLAGGGTGGTSTTTPPTTTPGNAFVDQNGQTARAGGSIDFGGHNFGSEEHVSVMLNGQQIATGFTNTGGGFSTGSLSLPSSPGTYTYTFVGQVSGKTAQATLTVQ